MKRISNIIMAGSVLLWTFTTHPTVITIRSITNFTSELLQLSDSQQIYSSLMPGEITPLNLNIYLENYESAQINFDFVQLDSITTMPLGISGGFEVVVDAVEREKLVSFFIQPGDASEDLRAELPTYTTEEDIGVEDHFVIDILLYGDHFETSEIHGFSELINLPFTSPGA